VTTFPLGFASRRRACEIKESGAGEIYWNWVVFGIAELRAMPYKPQLLPVLSVLDAYDEFAPYYRSYSEGRAAYLRTIEDIVIAHAGNPESMLDVGAGDGVRALRIAEEVGIRRIVLLEPSAGMRKRLQAPPWGEVWSFPVSEIPHTEAKFQLITCLWNVLGHLPDSAERLRMLTRLRGLLVPGGALFIDINHRYNALCYGWTWSVCRLVRDTFSWHDRRGDVTVTWSLPARTLCTQGHVFASTEIERLRRAAGLRTVARWIVDYHSGAMRRFPMLGNLLYQFGA
jgi:SAM-dependent methyltransferase